MKSSKKILILISQKNTPRVYIQLLKEHLQKSFSDCQLNFFISQHDDKRNELKKASYDELERFASEYDYLISLEGYLDGSILSRLDCQKILIFLEDVGKVNEQEKYLCGFDCLYTGSKIWDEYFEKICELKGIKQIKSENCFSKILYDEEKKKQARVNLYKRYPQICNKNIFSILVFGIKNKNVHIEQINIKKILNNMPIDSIIITNCRELMDASIQVESKYTDKLVMINERDLLDTCIASDKIISNMGVITAASNYVNGVLKYSMNPFERMIMEYSKMIIEPDCGQEEVIIGKFLY